MVDDLGMPVPTFTKPVSFKPFNSSSVIYYGDGVFAEGAVLIEGLRVHAVPGTTTMVEMQVLFSD